MTRGRYGETAGGTRCRDRRIVTRALAVCAIAIAMLGGASIPQTSPSTPASQPPLASQSVQAGTAPDTASAPGLPAAAATVSDRQQAQLPEPRHAKTIERLDDERYRLTLSVTGAEQSGGTIEQSSADVVLALDSSGSMSEKEDPTCHRPNTCLTRWQVVTQAASHLAQTLLASSASGTPTSVRMALVDFDTAASIVPVGGSQWTTDAAALSAAMDGLDASTSTGGGTNWEAGVHEANSLLAGSSAQRRYIVMLSDGLPTFRQSAMGHDDDWMPQYQAYGNGTSDPGGRCFDAAVAEADRRPAGTALFAVSAGQAAQAQMTAFATAAGGIHYSGTDPDSLDRAFDDIATIITSTVRYRDVSITDTLSSWVVALADDGTPATGPDAAVTPVVTASGPDNSPVSTDGITATFDPATGTLGLRFPETATLAPDITYRVSIDITPTADAYRSYITEGGYPDTGDEQTDAPGNDTSSGKPGFFSNAAGSALLRYRTVTVTVSGDHSEESVSDELTAGYARPVVQVAAPTLTLVKTVDNTHATAYVGAEPAAWTLSAAQLSTSAPEPGDPPADTIGGGTTGGIAPAAPTGPGDQPGTASLPDVALEPGTYRLAEARNDDYRIDGEPYRHYDLYQAGTWQCKDSAGTALDVSDDGDVTIAPGYHVTCTMTNTATPALADQIPLTGATATQTAVPWIALAAGLPLAGTGIWILRRSRRTTGKR